MVEKEKGHIKIEDAELVILKELLRYLYIGKIGPDFKKYKELMILANKYDVEDLVDEAGSKILEPMTEENALELGIFGETHNSTVLFNASAKIIQENPSVETLPDGWDKQLEGCPRLTVAIIGAFRKKGQEAKEFARFPADSGTDSGWSVGPGQVDAICFQVSTKVKLVGVGMYGVQGTNNKVALKIYQGGQLLSEEEKDYHSDGGKAVTYLQLKTAVKLEANTSYDITVERLCGRAEFWSGIPAIYFAEDVA